MFRIEGSHFGIGNGVMRLMPAPKRRALPKTRVERWLSRFFRFDLFDGGGRCLWLKRWTFWDRWGISLYLHHWLNDDWTVHHHDHSRGMVSIGLCGGYTEHLFDGSSRMYRAPWVRYFPAEHRHYITLDTPTAWTCVIGLRPTRKSSFWVNGEPMGADYLKSPFAEQQKRC